MTTKFSRAFDSRGQHLRESLHYRCLCIFEGIESSRARHLETVYFKAPDIFKVLAFFTSPHIRGQRIFKCPTFGSKRLDIFYDLTFSRETNLRVSNIDNFQDCTFSNDPAFQALDILQVPKFSGCSGNFESNEFSRDRHTGLGTHIFKGSKVSRTPHFQGKRILSGQHYLQFVFSSARQFLGLYLFKGTRIFLAPDMFQGPKFSGASHFRKPRIFMSCVFSWAMHFLGLRIQEGPTFSRARHFLGCHIFKVPAFLMKRKQ